MQPAILDWAIDGCQEVDVVFGIDAHETPASMWPRTKLAGTKS